MGIESVRRNRCLPLFALCLLSLWTIRASAQGNPSVRTHKAVFATVDSQELAINLWVPDQVSNPPVVVYIPGGGWSKLIYTTTVSPWLTEHGYAVARIDYRLAPEYPFPAPLHDCKAAIRWLRAHASEYGIDGSRIAVAGESAGGHLAVLLGVTNGEEAYEGNVGNDLDSSSRVDAIIDYYGPMDFVLRSKNQPDKTEKPGSPVYMLLGKPVGQDPEFAKKSSPAFQVSKGDPPLLIFHGDQDRKVLLDQSERIVEEYQKAGLEVTLEVVAGGDHGSQGMEPYCNPENQQKVLKFLKQHLEPVINFWGRGKRAEEWRKPASASRRAYWLGVRNRATAA
jgi:acetyl esterase/lipase